MQIVPPRTARQPEGTLTFTDPLFMRLIALAVGHDLHFAVGNAFYFAAWVGLLVTALNLIPSGQLDGGHAIYAVFGEKVHRWTGRIAFPVMAVLAIVGLICLRQSERIPCRGDTCRDDAGPAPATVGHAPLDAKRKAVAFLTLVIFVLCFVPFPIQIS